MFHDVQGNYSIKRKRFVYDGDSSHDSSPMTENVCWLVVAGVFIIKLTIPTFISAYGVILLYLVENNYYSLWHGLLPPVTYITCKNFSDPVCRNILSGQSMNSKSRTMCAISIIVASIAVNMFIESLILQVSTFGIFLGVCSSIVVTQAEAVLSCHFPTQRNLTQVLNHLTVALGYLVMPLLVNGLINRYGIHGSFLLQSGIVLQAVVGAALLGPPQGDDSDDVFVNRPRAYTIVDDVEMVDFSSSNNGNASYSPLLSVGRSGRNPLDSRYDIAQNSSPLSLMRQKNIHGVDILPEIPEETEESDSDSEPNNCYVQQETRSISKFPVNNFHKRYYLPTDSQDELHKKKVRVNQNKSFQKWRNINLHSENIGSSSILQIPAVHIQEVNYSEATRTLSSFVRHRDNIRFQRLESTSESLLRKPMFFQRMKYIICCGCFSKASLYEFYITILNFPNDMYFYMVVPLINAFKVPDFFPAVFLHTVLCLCPVVFTTFIPLLLRIRMPTSSSQEGAFAISLSAFTWLCFLMFSPCFLQAKISTRKIIYFIGSLFSSTGFYIVASARNHAFIVLGCTFIGLGHGACLETVTSILEANMGIRNFVKIQGPLDTLAGCFILLTSVLLEYLLQTENGLFNCFVTLSVLQMATSIVWIIPLLKAISLQLRHYANCDWHPGGDFLTPG